MDGGGRGGNVPRNAAACDTDACVGETGGRLSVVNSTTVPTAGTAKSQRRIAIPGRFSFHSRFTPSCFERGWDFKISRLGLHFPNFTALVEIRGFQRPGI